MSQDLCLKWNNHSSSFVKLLDDLHLQELYSDVTLLCQGKFYPVHRFVLSTCSEYFQEMFSLCKRYSNKYPFIIIKDINSLQMEALLNYMYKGEVNVPQDLLPDLIKAAEVFKIKGLAVQDDEDIKLKSPKRRSNSTSPQPRKNRKIERRGKTVDSTLIDNSNSSELSNSLNDVNNPISEITIKNEPQDIIEKTTTTESEPSENDSITQSHMRSYNDSYDPLYLLKDDSNTVWGPTDFDNYESDEVDDQYSNQMIIGRMATPPGQERLQMSNMSLAFMQTEKGNRRLLIDDHCFYKEKEYLNKIHWKCEKYKKNKCPARVTTVDDKIARMPKKDHNHVGGVTEHYTEL